MQTVVLCAGEGTRMRPLTASRPKPMLPVAGRPLVEYALDAAIEAGASELVFVVGYAAECVRSHFGDAYRDVPIEYAVQPQRRGTADALRVAVPYLDSEPFAVLNGDSLYDPASTTELFRNDAAVGSYRVDDPSNYGVLRLDDDTVTEVVEKPADPDSNLVNTGAYVFPAAARDWLDVAESERGELEITDVLDRTCRERTVRSVPFDRWLDVGRPWELLEANELVLGEIETTEAGEVSPDATLVGPVYVDPTAEVRAGVTIEGPVYVDEHAEVGPNAYVRGHTYLGPDVRVGNAVEIKNSVLMEGSSAAHLTYVGDSVVGRDVNFGAGTTVGNLRHDGEPVRITVKDERVSTGRRKFGIVCGDRVKTGIDTSIDAGVVLTTDAHTTPGETVLRDR